MVCVIFLPGALPAIRPRKDQTVQQNGRRSKPAIPKELEGYPAIVLATDGVAWGSDQGGRRS